MEAVDTTKTHVGHYIGLGVGVCFIFVMVYGVVNYIKHDSSVDDLVSTEYNKYSDPFGDPNYSMTSYQSLGPKEKTISYDYSGNPCGTLMTEFVSSGSVYVGRGPVYGMALKSCRADDPLYVPDDQSFRTYSCQNRSFSETDGSSGPIFGHATFAFTCH